MSNQQKTGASFPGYLEEMTVDEVRTFKPEVVVVPLGSTEPHGPHLPYGTDTYEVTRLALMAVQQANARGARVLLYPTLPITNNANARAHPFALRIGVRTLMTVLIDIVTQCKEDGIRKVVITNGHGGNIATIQAALRELAGMDNMPFTCLCSGWDMHDENYKNPIEFPSEHAGEKETSYMMWIRPDLVRTELRADNPVGKLRIPLLAKSHFVRPWHLYVPTSAGGESRKASAEKGEYMYQHESKVFADLLVELSNAKVDEKFPYL
jgi:creatinine amidohydrolase